MAVLTAIYQRQVAWFDTVVSKISAPKLVQLTEALAGVGDALESEIDAESEQ